eukprot:SAG11_NODE_1039_length_6074_cov_11.968870_6_plen_153_part_00
MVLPSGLKATDEIAEEWTPSIFFSSLRNHLALTLLWSSSSSSSSSSCAVRSSLCTGSCAAVALCRSASFSIVRVEVSSSSGCAIGCVSGSASGSGSGSGCDPNFIAPRPESSCATSTSRVKLVCGVERGGVRPLGGVHLTTSARLGGSIAAT